jgi:carboxylate-amine ligase
MTIPAAFSEHAFGRSDPFTVGVEEELLLVDPATRALSNSSAEVLAAMGAASERASHEAFASELELRSSACRTAGEARAELAQLRSAARAAGATLLGAGLHPTAGWGEAPLVDSDRYRVVGETMRGLITRTPDCALHVHVAMPDPESATRALCGLRAHLPVLIALGANSPLWFGADSGLDSARYSHVRAYPRRGVPPACGDYESYASTVGELMHAGGFDDYTLVWWNVRLQPRIGTVEVREIDAQARLAGVGGLAALIQALARMEVDEQRAGAPMPSAAALDELSFLAARDGLDGEVPHGGGRAPLSVVARELLERARPHARALGSEPELDGIAAILEEGNGARRQRAALADGGPEAVLELLARESAAA